VAISIGTKHTINFGISLILAKLLFPEDFGLLGINSMVLAVLSVLQGLGLYHALIYNRRDDRVVTSTAFIITVLYGLFQFLIAFMIAPYIARFYNDPELLPIIRTSTLALPITSLGVVPLTLLDKELDFKRKLIPEISPLIVYAVLIISLAMLNYGVWSVIVGQIFQSVTFAITSWYIGNWRPSWEFDWGVAQDLLKYGKDVVSASALAALFLYSDNFWIGRILGLAELGIYAFAFSIANIPVMLITNLINVVSFPTYVHLNDDPFSLRHAYLKILRLSSTISAAACFGILAISEHLILVIYGEKWVESIILLKLLSLFGLMRTIINIPVGVMMAIGKQHVAPKLQLTFLSLVNILLIFALPTWGTIGAAISMTTIVALALIIYLLLVKHFLSLSLMDYFNSTLAPLVSGLLMASILLQLSSIVELSLNGLIFLIIIGAFIYITAISTLTKGKIFVDLVDLFNNLRPTQRVFPVFRNRNIPNKE
jgi:PST family polysaccharide transporter